jgi:hypothetical protein
MRGSADRDAERRPGYAVRGSPAAGGMTMAESDNPPDRGSQFVASDRNESFVSRDAHDDGDVQDRYVARRIAEHRAATAEANAEAAGPTLESEAASPTGGFGFPLLLGLLVAALLLLVIYLATQG